MRKPWAGDTAERSSVTPEQARYLASDVIAACLTNTSSKTRASRKKGDAYIPTCDISAILYNDHQYQILFELYQLLEVIQDDIPLASWAVIENTIRQLVDSGNL